MKTKASVGASDNPDAIKAGREAMVKSLQGIGKEDPKFSIVFSTIHYEKNLKSMLAEINSITNTPLVGCTGGAIIVPDSVHARGVGVLTVSGDFGVGVGVGEHTRTSPIKAGEKAIRMAMEDLGETEYENKYGIIFPSGMKFPNIPGMKSMMKMSISKLMFPMLSNFMAMVGTGPARYEEILTGVMNESKGEIPIVSGGAFDDFKGQRNFQFLNDNVYHDSIVALLIASDAKLKTRYKHGLKPTGKEMKVTKAKGNLAFEINNKPAWEGFKEVYEIPPELEDKWKDNPVIMTIYQVPAEKDEEGNYWIIAPLCVIGDAILFAKDVEETTLYICRGTGGDILYAAKDVALDATKDIEPAFSLVFTTVPRIMTMMEKIDVERQYIKEVMGDKPFMGFYCCAGGIYAPGEPPFLKCLNETITVSVFGE